MSRQAEHLLPAAYALLALLSEGPAHGYELHRSFAPGAPLAEVYRLASNQLYALLKKLNELGLVEESGYAPVGNTPPRRYFAITVAGMDELDGWLREPVAHTREVRLDFLVKLYFAARRGPQEARYLLQAQLRLTRQIVANLEEQRSKMAGEPIDFRHLVFDLRLNQSRAVLAWLEEALSADPTHWFQALPAGQN